MALSLLKRLVPISLASEVDTPTTCVRKPAPRKHADRRKFVAGAKIYLRQNSLCDLIPLYAFKCPGLNISPQSTRKIAEGIDFNRVFSHLRREYRVTVCTIAKISHTRTRLGDNDRQTTQMAH